MLSTEILNTEVTPEWKNTDIGYVGAYEIDDKKIEIDIHKYDTAIGNKTYSLVDFGFRVNDSWEITNEFKNSSKILGSIINAFIVKIKSINPDCIIFSVNFKNDSVENRKYLYGIIAKIYSKGSSFHFMADWIKTKNGEYRLISKTLFKQSDLDEITKFVESIEEKV